MTVDEVTGELVPAAPLTMTTAAVGAYMDEYDKTCRLILKPDDVQRIGKREFIKRSGWRKLGVWAMVSAEITEELIVRDGDGPIKRAMYKVRASAPNGRFMEGIGICDRSERSFTHPEHDICATAHTRAINRAFADLFGLGAVSAEEMDADLDRGREGVASPPARTRRAQEAVAGQPIPAAAPAPPNGTEEQTGPPSLGVLEDRIAALPQRQREHVREFIDARKLPWPSETSAVRTAVDRELGRIEGEASEERESYYTPGAESPLD